MPFHCITGGAGFIGSCHVLRTCGAGFSVVDVDKLTYSGNMDNLATLQDDAGHVFVRRDIANTELIAHVLHTFQTEVIVNLAAESHVDRSIHDPDAFVCINVLGTSTLLWTVLDYWRSLPAEGKCHFRFLHVSTDEVFGSLQPEEPSFTEQTPYTPTSPYAASKAAADHFVRAFHETYGLPTLITNCSNNYRPRQFPEKLIPLTISNALAQQPIPVYGTGENIRDWLYVEHHSEGLDIVLSHGESGSVYAVGGRSEVANMDMARAICSALDKLCPRPQGSYAELMTFVHDRPGHDFRYSINCTLLENTLDWKLSHTLSSGLESTIHWNLDNSAWVARARSGQYRDGVRLHYGRDGATA